MTHKDASPSKRAKQHGVEQANLDNWFEYHQPTSDQPGRYERIRAAGKAFAETVLAETPASADQTVAIRAIREAVMWANASIACSE